MSQAVYYNHWKTGRGMERPLVEGESKTSLRCPFDKTFLISYHDESEEGTYCPNCGIDYSGSGRTQYEIEDFVRDYFETIKSRLQDLREDKKTLEHMLEIAKTKRLVD